jgi:uncharacterized protein YacL
MYIVAYLVNELHLNYFVIIITTLITTLLTCSISLVLKIFGINDSIENDKKILKSFGINRDNKNKNDKNKNDRNNKLKID